MPVLGQSESDVEDEGPLGVFPGGDAVEDLDGDAALEEVVEDDQALEEVTAETVDFLNGEHVAGAYVGQRLEEDGAILSGEGAADLLFEHFPADRVESVVLSAGVLFVGADPDEADERHEASPFVHQTSFAVM